MDKKVQKIKHKDRVYKITDQLLTLMLDPMCSVDTEMMVYYLKSKIKINEKRSIYRQD